MAGANVEHFSADPETRKGYFRKDSDGQSKRYQTVWKGMAGAAKGFGESLYQIHHIIPETSIYNKMVYKIEDKAQRDYLLNCMWISDWNINGDINLVGLPDLFTFLIYFDSKKREEEEQERKAELEKSGHGGYISNKIKSFHSQYTKDKRKVLLGENANPETYPVHLPVSWGHTHYNWDVADELKKKVAERLNAVKEDHKVDPKGVEAAFNSIAKKRRRSLETQGKAGDLGHMEKALRRKARQRLARAVPHGRGELGPPHPPPPKEKVNGPRLRPPRLLADCCSARPDPKRRERLRTQPGAPRAEGWPSDASFHMDDDFGLLLDDVIRCSGGLFVISKRFRELLEAEGVPNLEMLPVTLHDTKGRPLNDEYVVCHLTPLQDVLALDEMDIERSPIDPRVIDGVDDLVIREDALDPGVRLFRPAEYSEPLLFERGLAETVEEAGFTGIAFRDLDEFNPYKAL